MTPPDATAALLARIRSDQRRAGAVPRPAATDPAIADLSARVQTALGLTLPPHYAAFLRHSDGLDDNGLGLYDGTSSPDHPAHPFARGLIPANRASREAPRTPRPLYPGDTDMDLVAADRDGAVLTPDRVSDDITNRHLNLATLFAALMAHRI